MRLFGGKKESYMRIYTVNILVQFLLFFTVALDGKSMSLEEFRSQPDRRPAIRQSLGVRSAHAAGPRDVVVVIGMSVTEVGKNPAAYRIISYDDPAYAYEKFVRPEAAEVRDEVEAEGIKGSPFGSFSRRIVTLRLPLPMREGAAYHIVAQGVGKEMVTAARTAAGFTYGGKNAGRDPHVDLAVIGLRAIEPVGNGILLVEFGPGYAPDQERSQNSWKITINDKPVGVNNLGRITRVDTYLPVGWPFVAIPMHEVFLQLDQPFTVGDVIRVEVAAHLTAGVRDARMRFDEAKTFSSAIKVNQVGYLTDSPVKQAYLGRWMGSFPESVKKGQSTGGSMDDLFGAALQSGEVPVAADNSLSPALWFSEPPSFTLRDAATHETVFTGQSKLIHRSGEMNEGVFPVDHSGENVYLLDFTEFKQEGTFYIAVKDVGRGLPFRIAKDVYDQAFQVASKGVFTQRCGIELKPPYSEWRRIACHNKGIVPTTLSRMSGEKHAHQQLPEYVDYHALTDAELPPAIQVLNRDPALVAYWPLDGDFGDASGNGRNLTPLREGQAFERVKELMPGQNQALGPSKSGVPNGGMLSSLALNMEKGFTLASWVKLPGGNKFDGTLIVHTNSSVNLSRIQTTAAWGVLRGFLGMRGEPAIIGRLSDNTWHHIALVAEPAAEASAQLLFYVDGEVRGIGSAGSTDQMLTNEFVVGLFTGEQADGKFIDDVRIYERPLVATEVNTLAQRWGDLAIALKASGGHHDAGDYNPRSHIEVAQILMNAYEMAPRKFRDGQLAIPENANGIPDILDEAAWAIRLWLDLQDEDGGVRGGTESNGDPGFITTVELDLLGDYAFAKDPGASFEFAGVLAQAARLWKSLGRETESADMLERAKRAYRWAMEHPIEKADTVDLYAKFYLSPKAYAAAELLHTTGEEVYKKDFADAAVWAKKPEAELQQHRLYDQRLAAWSYAKCPAEVADPAMQESIRKAIIKEADTFIEHCSKMGYRFLRHPWAPISWGTGAYQNWTDSSFWAYALTGDKKYLQWIIHTCDNTLGANPLNISYITGLGTRTVRAPLHNSRYSHFGEVAPGMQVQGPNQRGEGYQVSETAHPKIREDFASLYTFVDCHYAIVMNEGTVVPQARTMAAFGLLLPEGDGL